MRRVFAEKRLFSEDPFLVIPKFDRVAVILLFYVWWMLSGIAGTQGLAAPITIAMYGWTNEEAILYNGIAQVVSCGMSAITCTLMGSTRIGKWSAAMLTRKKKTHIQHRMKIFISDRRILLALGITGF
ncbi:hypothetical protein OESDEN_22246, partial [Oesophagostomum dentatum]